MNYAEINEALEVVVQPGQAQGLSLSEALQRLDAAHAQPELKRAHPHLRHYLQNRSYQKAHAYLREHQLV
ncbi:MAG: hypothetical protein Q7P63_08775 [Verrucomicrobiota bacterium JB022]|nr:hypothetical protein [Verrucomicrobiota bacterium JB022]